MVIYGRFCVGTIYPRKVASMTAQNESRNPCHESWMLLEAARVEADNGGYEKARLKLTEAFSALPPRSQESIPWNIEPQIFALWGKCWCLQTEDIKSSSWFYSQAAELTQELYGPKSVILARLLVDEVETLVSLPLEALDAASGHLDFTLQRAEEIIFGTGESPPSHMDPYLAGRWFSVDAYWQYAMNPKRNKDLAISSMVRATQLMRAHHNGARRQLEEYRRHLKRAEMVYGYYGARISALVSRRQCTKVVRKLAAAAQ